MFKEDRVPILGYRTSLQMKLITVEDDNFDIAAVSESLVTQYPAVFDGCLGSLPGTQQLKLDPEAQPKIMATRRTPISVRPQVKKALQIGDNVRMQPIRTRRREWKETTVTQSKTKMRSHKIQSRIKKSFHRAQPHKLDSFQTPWIHHLVKGIYCPNHHCTSLEVDER